MEGRRSAVGLLSAATAQVTVVRHNRTCRSQNASGLRRLTIIGLVSLVLVGSIGTTDARRSSSGQQIQRPEQDFGSKYSGLFGWWNEMKYRVSSASKSPQVLEEAYSTPPKPLQVFEYGPSRRTFLLYPERYKYQYVCVVSRSGKVAEGVWHRRKAPTNWVKSPPYYMRIVRPTPGGMLHYMMATGKAKLEKVDITITAEDEETGETKDFTRRMTVVQRTDVDVPRKQRLREWIDAHKPSWMPGRPEYFGRWAPKPGEQDPLKLAVDMYYQQVAAGAKASPEEEEEE